ncbi:uncharacterized protein BXZ73DRAFT_99147 [Epithele typhae]|uniref:uncharacterized protein n=1 Tax=Epithele typhae TaxID=378194 RepID=UPI00200731A2|nr:uncharacterized protein BXZ73DRAFT_99147 [Epithele typhae]KAH9940152.1 hypothetical protein BXZ73DRAFT_99147 [Epithele typhae]
MGNRVVPFVQLQLCAGPFLVLPVFPVLPVFCSWRNISTDHVNALLACRSLDELSRPLCLGESPVLFSCAPRPPPPQALAAPRSADDPLPEGRTTGQLIALPSGRLLVLGGSHMGQKTRLARRLFALYPPAPLLRKQSKVLDDWRNARLANVPALLTKYGIDVWLRELAEDTLWWSVENATEDAA